MGKILYMGGRLKIVRLAKESRPETVKTNVFAFPIMEGMAKTCGNCGRPYSASEEVCPDCGTEKEDEK